MLNNKQYVQVSKVLSMYKDTQKIIFIGHHPIIQCRFKKSDAVQLLIDVIKHTLNHTRLIRCVLIIL